MRYPADPPTVEEIVAVLREAGHGRSAERLRGVIVVLWRAGLRVSEAIMLNETDLSASTGSITVRFGKGGRRRQVGTDPSAWAQLHPWLDQRQHLPAGPLFCVTAATCTDRHSKPESGGASHRTNSDTPTPSRWPAKGSRST
jgi:site-specific recombinase XerC